MKTFFNQLPTNNKKNFYGVVELYKKMNLSPDEVFKSYGTDRRHASFCYALFQYVLRGEHAVVLGNKLHSLFSNTDCHKIPEKLFNLPFDCFYIQFPDKNEGVFVANQLTTEGSRKRIQITYVKKDPTLSMYDEKGIAHLHLPLPFDLLIPDKDGYLNPEKVIQDMAKGHFDDVEVHQFDSTIVDISKIVRIVCNTILYMNSIDADIKTEHNKNKSNKKTARKTRTTRANKPTKKAKTNNTVVIWLGKTLEDDPNIQSIPTGRSNNWSVRRGHWHSFWTGSRTDPETKEPRKGEELVLKWVKPIYRNIVNVPQKQREVRFVK